MKKMTLFVLGLVASLSAANAADLQVAVEGMGIDKGKLYFALFDRDQFLQKPVAVASGGPEQAVVTFRHLQPGTYAVFAYQDINGNGVLDRNLVGTPLEPYGFSNDAVGRMGPPKFEAAAVRIDAEDRPIILKLR